MYKLKIVELPKPLNIKTQINFPEVVLGKMQEKTVKPKTTFQEILPDKNYDGLSKVNVEAVTNEIDTNIKSENIKKDVSILGVQGNIEELKGTKLEITKNGTYTPEEPYNAFTEVKVNAGKIYTGSYDKEGLEQIGWSNEEIEYYNMNGVQWNESENDLFKLNNDELLGNDSSTTRFLPKNSTKTSFESYYGLLAIPQINFSSTNMVNMFSYCYSLTTIPLLDTSGIYIMSYMFSNCKSLTTIPQLNTSKVYNMSNMFNGCTSLQTIPLLDTNRVSNMSSMFNGCYSLKTIPQLNTSNVTNMANMFSYCHSLKTIPLLDTSKVTDLSQMFNDCRSLQTIPLLDTSNATNFYACFWSNLALVTVPQLNTNKSTNMNYMFNDCRSLQTIPLLNANNVTTMSGMFTNCYSLKNFGGLQNIGQAYLTTQPANYNDYKLDLSSCTKLTHDSLINVINNLYDIATKGVKTQKLVLGSTNISKLSADEIAIATNKGFSVS